MVAIALFACYRARGRRCIPETCPLGIQTLFESAPVCLWWADLSCVKSHLDQLRSQGVTDIRAHLESHPDDRKKLFSLIKIVDVNNETLKLHRPPSKEALLATPARVFTHKSYRLFQEELVALAEGRRHFETDTEVQTFDGQKVQVFLRMVLDEESPDWSNAFLAIVDITQRRLGEEHRHQMSQLELEAQKQESLGILAGGVAHDFNNLLMAVLGNSDLALEEVEKESLAATYLGEIHSASLRAADLCQQMLAYAGKGHPEKRPLNLNEITTGLGYLIRSMVPRKIDLRQQLCAEPPMIHADPSQLQQVLMNLITNSVEAIGSSQGELTLETGHIDYQDENSGSKHLTGSLPAGPYAYLRVIDNGEGMATETRNRLFDPFFSTRFTGRGLGLSAVLGIVRMHGGGIQVESEPGLGTTFTVLFPVATASDPALVPSTTPPPDQKTWQGSGLVLLADDEPEVRRVATRMLKRLGFEVMIAEDGQEAVELFNEHHNQIDAVVLDLVMPVLTGNEAFALMRNLADNTPILLSSGYSEEDCAARFGDQSPTGFIQKPYTLARLREAMRRVAESRSIR